MPSLAFALSLIALLFAPGPTNALLALSGAERGARPALRLLPVVLLAYGLTVLPLAALGADLLHQQHAVRAGVTLAAALWVAWMAYALWQRPAATDATPGGGALRLFITTLLNPKALIIGLVLVPQQAQQGGALVLVFVVLGAAAAGWVLLGAALHGRTAGGMPLLRRICAGWLGLLAVMLGSAALSA